MLPLTSNLEKSLWEVPAYLLPLGEDSGPYLGH